MWATQLLRVPEDMDPAHLSANLREQFENQLTGVACGIALLQAARHCRWRPRTHVHTRLAFKDSVFALMCAARHLNMSVDVVQTIIEFMVRGICTFDTDYMFSREVQDHPLSPRTHHAVDEAMRKIKRTLF